MSPVLEALREKFDGRIRPLETQSAAQVCAALDAPDVPAVTQYLETEHAARLVLLFAEDRVRPEYAFHIYYVFERPGDPVYLILRASLAAGQPSFPSLAAELPAVNWQEREIQELELALQQRIFDPACLAPLPQFGKVIAVRKQPVHLHLEFHALFVVFVLPGDTGLPPGQRDLFVKRLEFDQESLEEGRKGFLVAESAGAGAGVCGQCATGRGGQQDAQHDRNR